MFIFSAFELSFLGSFWNYSLIFYQQSGGVLERILITIFIKKSVYVKKILNFKFQVYGGYWVYSEWGAGQWVYILFYFQF